MPNIIGRHLPSGVQTLPNIVGRHLPSGVQTLPNIVGKHPSRVQTLSNIVGGSYGVGISVYQKDWTLDYWKKWNSMSPKERARVAASNFNMSDFMGIDMVVSGGVSKGKGKPGYEKGGFFLIKPSMCLEGLKQFAALPGQSVAVTGRSLILGTGSTVDYTYDKKTGKYLPVLTRLVNGIVTIVSPKGSVKTSGRNCVTNSGQTSYELLAQLLKESEANAYKAVEIARRTKFKSVQAKRKHFRGLENATQATEAILRICASENIEKISFAARLSLSQLRHQRPGRENYYTPSNSVR